MTVEAGSLSKSIARAKARLSDMVVQEVSLVDAAANLRKFVVVKGIVMTTGIEKGMKIPKAAKKSLSDGVAKALDELTKFAEALSASEADDGASVPGEVGKYLAQTALSLDGLAKQYGGEKDPKKDPEPTEKRGAKMSKARMERLKSAFKASGDAAALLKEIMSEVEPEEGDDVAKAMISCPKCGSKNFDTAKVCKDCGADLAAKGDDVEKRVEAAVAKALGEHVERTKSIADRDRELESARAEIKKRDDALAAKERELAEAQVEIKKAREQVPAPASRGAEGEGKTTPVIWPSDMNHKKKS